MGGGLFTAHPVWASLICPALITTVYSALIIVVFRTPAMRKYRSATASPTARPTPDRPLVGLSMTTPPASPGHRGLVKGMQDAGIGRRPGQPL